MRLQYAVPVIVTTPKPKPRPCSRCGGENTVRKGISLTGKQNHFCSDCQRSFVGGKARAKEANNIHGLMCYRCGGFDCFGQGVKKHTGRAGYCRSCRKYFTQGGSVDLERYHLLLEARVTAQNLPADVAAEVLQSAVVDVLEGRGYCWTVELRTAEAWRNCRGEYRDAGSDHQRFRLENGQRPVLNQ